MQPLLELVSDGKEHSNREAVAKMADVFGLTPGERSQLIPSGIRPTIEDRALWAVLYLKRADFLRSVRRGWFASTVPGQAWLDKRKANPATPPLTARTLLAESKEFESWFRSKSAGSTAVAPSSGVSVPPTSAPAFPTAPSPSTPLQRLEEAYSDLFEKIKSELVESMRRLDDREFEIFIARLLPRLGYGKDARDILQAHGRSHDGGIDGIVQLDALGAERIYVQAKHWKSPVDLEPVQQFEEKVRTSGVKSGLFVALSGFDGKASRFVREHQHNIAWIDSDRLAEVMITKGVGVIRDGSYDVYRVDEEYFELESD